MFFEGLLDLDDEVFVVRGELLEDRRALNGLIDSIHRQNSRIHGTRNILDAMYASSLTSYDVGGGKQRNMFLRRKFRIDNGLKVLMTARASRKFPPSKKCRAILKDESADSCAFAVNALELY